MKIVEGKQAVLKPYRTEKTCILPREGQTVLPLEPVDIIMRKPVKCETQTLQGAGEIIQHVETKTPRDCILRKVSEADMQKPVECFIREIPDVKIHSAIESAAHIDDITINSLQTTKAQVISATPELEQMMEETEPKMPGLKKRKWFADKILHITNLQ